jgi:hypothetical protein
LIGNARDPWAKSFTRDAHAAAFCLRIICSENRYPLFGIML